MDVKYTQLRVDKLNDLYNPSPTESMGAGNRCTRIHEDAFFLTDKHIISGSHDYCNWVWSLDKPDPEIKGVYTAEHQNGGTESDPFDVLDDFYWNSESDAPVDWVPGSERAGWWVKTPNQVLCFWHGVAMSSEQNVFAVCRPGKMFVWDLDSGNNVRGYTCLVPESGERQRWMGKLRTAGERLKGWYTCEGVMPEQGLWLLYEDGESVYIGRDELLKACGIEGTDWGWSRADFVFEKDMVDRGDMAPEQEEDSGERESEDEDWAGSPKGCAKRQRIEEA